MFSINTLSFTGVLVSALATMAVLQFFALLFIPSMMTPGARPRAVGRAIYCYMLQLVGIILMTLGGLPAFYSVLEKFVFPENSLTTETYIALLLIFTAGGLLFLWHEHIVQFVDEPSRRVSEAIYWYTLKIVGVGLALFSALSFFLTMLMAPQSIPTWWISPFLLFLYGALLVWCTRTPGGSAKSFHSQPGTNSSSAQAMKKKPRAR